MSPPTHPHPPPPAPHRPVTAEAFRHWVLRPAEGVFLFHPRAIERLHGLGTPRGAMEVCYHLMARGPFLQGLEVENPEALSVIEGLRLPEWVILLPMPGAPVLRSTPQRTLLRDYWARRFEGEVARTWQTARDDNQDLTHFGPVTLTTLIGGTALAEAREVLARDGVPEAVADEAQLGRAFVARVVRLRYFAPGSRGCCFPAVPDWAAVDRWLEEGGLDLPPPRSGGRLPQAMERTRPSVTCGTPGLCLQLPADLPYGRSDPDRLTGACNWLVQAEPPVCAPPDPAPAETAPVTTPGLAAHLLQGVGPDPGARPRSDVQSRCLLALHRGAAIRRRPGRLARLGAGLAEALQAPLDGLLDLWGTLSRVLARERPPLAGRALLALIATLRAATAAAQRADWEGRFAAALRHLAALRARYEAAIGPGDGAGEHTADPVLRLLDQRQRATAETFAQVLATTWRLSPATADELGELLRRLAAERGAAARPAQTLLGQLETALREARTTYYRIRLRAWFTPAGPRQVLPFQGPLKALAALDGARRLLEELPWPVADLDRLGGPLATLAGRIDGGLQERLRARLLEVLETAGLVPADPAGRLAGRRLADSLARLIRRQRQLRFADLRDLLNQDTLSLPDAQWGDWRYGDRLGSFDQAAALALPGIYRPGEFYVKGLQRLSAPLFGTRRGRHGLRLVLLPALAAWAVLAVTALLWGLWDSGHPPLTTPWVVLLLAAVLSASANTDAGRRWVRRLWRGAAGLTCLLLLTGLPRLLRSAPIRWLLERRLVRGLLGGVLAPVTIGLLPLLPPAVLWFLVTPGAPGPARWAAVLALAYALGTRLRDTPAGRRQLDDLTTAGRQFRELLRQERLADLIAPVMEFFKRGLRALDEGLHRIGTRLSPRLGEAPAVTLLKALAAPLWAAWEAVLQFYVVVLIEPQTNPIKHFPVVTLGHKLLLPLLPTLGRGLHAGLSPLLPAPIALPLIAVTLFLLPGLFGFLFWELKENWRLYGANRAHPVPRARLGTHGHTLNGLLRRGLHGGIIPKAFDRLRQVLDRQVRDEAPDPRALRRALARLAEITALIAHFGEQELAISLREACRGGGAGASDGAAQLTMQPPRLASRGIELRIQRAGAATAAPAELVLQLALGTAAHGSQLTCTLDWRGPWADLDPESQWRMAAVVQRFARRCGALIAESPSPDHSTL